jgi:hypothetical protein
MIDDGLHTFEAGICLFKNSIKHLSNEGIYDKLNEDSDDLYTFCGEKSMRWFYPSHHGNFFKIVEFVEPNNERN